MIEAKISWNKENIGRFVKYTLSNGGKNKTLSLIYIIIVSVLGIGGIIYAVILSQPWMIIISLLLVLMVIIYSFVMYFTVSKYIDKMVDNFKENTLDTIEFSDKVISIREGNTEKGLISWNSVTKFECYKTDVFVTLENGIIFIISETDIREGSFNELISLLNDKVKVNG